MRSRFTGYRAVALCFWCLSLLAIVIWRLTPTCDVGWDSHVYVNAIMALRNGHDPYADGIAVQRAFHAVAAQHPGAPTPFTYVYSPITLPLLRLIGQVPFTLSARVYWTIYALALAVTIWVGMRFIKDSEQPVFQLVAPVAVFFPGMLLNDVFFSGNVAYILYGLVFVAAYWAWKRGSWWWFYAAVLAASCVKAPMLTLLAVPVFSARGQWRPALITGALGLALFFVQPAIWPVAFRHYLEAVELQFSFNHDFSSSPAGLMANALYDVIPYQVTSSVFYLVYAVPFTLVLWFLSRRYFAGRITLKEWVPVLLVGTLLLNPRIMEYDIAPMTLPMALILWRFIRRGQRLWRAAAIAAMLFGLLQKSAAGSGWRSTACVLMVTLFAVGTWDLLVTDQVQVRDEEASLQVAEA